VQKGVIPGFAAYVPPPAKPRKRRGQDIGLAAAASAAAAAAVPAQRAAPPGQPIQERQLLNSLSVGGFKMDPVIIMRAFIMLYANEQVSCILVFAFGGCNIIARLAPSCLVTSHPEQLLCLTRIRYARLSRR
jgi:hypothetical protein